MQICVRNKTWANPPMRTINVTYNSIILSNHYISREICVFQFVKKIIDSLKIWSTQLFCFYRRKRFPRLTWTREIHLCRRQSWVDYLVQTNFFREKFAEKIQETSFDLCRKRKLRFFFWLYSILVLPFVFIQEV